MTPASVTYPGADVRRPGFAVAAVAALLIAAPGGVRAQVVAPERVIVLFDDLSGRAVQGASVRVEPGGLVRTSDAAGEVRVPLAAGPYTLTITAIGYGDAQVRVEVPETETGPLELGLVPRPVPVEGLDVEAARDREAVDVTGVVVDLGDGHRLAGATVSFPFASRRWVALTDGEGRFRIPGVQSGAHWIQATHLGYEGAAVSVAVGEGSEQDVVLALRPDTALLRGVATIESRLRSDRRAYAFSPVRTVDRERIARSPWWRDAQDMLRAVGIHVIPCEDASDGSSCVAARGGGTNPVDVCVDGFMVIGGLDQLRTYHPRELHLVEVFDRGALLHAYTVAFMAQQGRRPERMLRCPDPNVG